MDPQGSERAGDQPMVRAVALGETARRRSAPNPWVGAVVVRDGVVVGEGATEPPGARHAEVVALTEAGERARGATVFVTLEPCAHRGRTPPCTDALAAAGVERIVVACDDPDPRVAGQGLARLRAAGIAVERAGAPATVAVAWSLAPYLHQRTAGRAFAVLKVAAGLDGRVAAPAGGPRWLTGPAARADAHGLRADSQAVVIGSGTALADRPALTVRDAPGPTPASPPLRVLLDGRGRVPAAGPLFDPTLAPILVATTDAAARSALEAWKRAGAEVALAPAAAGGEGVDLRAVLEILAGRGVVQALVEGGPRVHAALLDAGCADRLVLYLAPLVLGPDAPVLGTGGTSGPAPGRWRCHDVVALGDDVRLTYEPAGRAA